MFVVNNRYLILFFFLQVRLQNHLLSSQAGVLVQNGPFPPVAVAVPVQPARDAGNSRVLFV